MAQEPITDSPTGRQIVIYSDSQAAVRSLRRSEGRSGAQISMQIRQRIQSLQERGNVMMIRWMPAQKSILGNAGADNAVKQVTGWRIDDAAGPRAHALKTPRQPLTSMKACCRKMSNERWQVAWRSESKGRATFREVVIPSKRVLRLHEGLSKSQSSLLVQLRTDKIDLEDFSFR